MSNATQQFFETFDQVDKIDPISANSQQNGAWVSVANFARLVAKLQVGVIAATGTITFRVSQAVNASGGSAKVLKSCTAYADTDDGKSQWLEILPTDLDQANGFTFIRMEIICATAASLVAAELLGIGARYKPVVQPATLTRFTV